MKTFKTYLDITFICVSLLATYSGIMNYIIGLQLKGVLDKLNRIEVCLSDTIPKVASVENLVGQQHVILTSHEKRLDILEIARKYKVDVSTNSKDLAKAR